MKPPYGLLVFDLDGTLIDSSQDLAQSVNATRADAGLAPLSAATVASYVGNGAETLIRRALGAGAADDTVSRGLAFFLRYYRAHMLDHTVLYDGVREALHGWHASGLPMAVLTNKPEAFSRSLVAGLGVGHCFARVYGGNSFPAKKPDPRGLRSIMREFGFSPPATMMVGDSCVDVLTARNAGTACAGVSYGLRPEDFQRHPPDIVVDDMRELAAAMATHGQRGRAPA